MLRGLASGGINTLFQSYDIYSVLFGRRIFAISGPRELGSWRSLGGKLGGGVG